MMSKQSRILFWIPGWVAIGLPGVMAVAQSESGSGMAPQDPIAILRKAHDAVKSAKVIQYDTTVQPFGTFEVLPPRLEGHVVFGGWKGNQPEKFRYDITIMPVETSGGKRVTLGWDGGTYYVIDYDLKKVHVSKNPNVFGTFSNALASFPVTEFLRTQPYEFELTSGSVKLQGTTRVGDEDCFELHVEYPARVTQDKALWYFSKKDYLLRRLDKVNHRGPGDRHGRQVILTNMVLDPKLPEDPFALKVPEGFEKTDRPAS